MSKMPPKKAKKPGQTTKPRPKSCASPRISSAPPPEPILAPASIAWHPSRQWMKGSRKIQIPRVLFRSCKLKMGDWIRVEFPQHTVLGQAWPFLDGQEEGDCVAFVDTTLSIPRAFSGEGEEGVRVQKLVVSPDDEPCVPRTIHVCVRWSRANAATASTPSLEEAESVLQRILSGAPCFPGLRIVSCKERLAFEILSIDPVPSGSTQTPLFVGEHCKFTFALASLSEDVKEQVDIQDTVEGLAESLEQLHVSNPLSPSLEEDPAYPLLSEMLTLPLRYGHFFTALGLTCAKGILLSGPPGVGKTYLAARVARESGAKLFVVHAQDIVSPYVGDGEKELRRRFEEARLWCERTRKPCILLMDEVDALVPRREETSQQENRIVAQLLTLLDGMQDRRRSLQMVVVAATNRPNSVDPALRRPGRLEREVVLSVPNEAMRWTMLKEQCAKLPLDPRVRLEEVAQRTQGYVGADLASVVQEAALHALQRHRTTKSPISEMTVTPQDVSFALQQVAPSLHRGYQRNLEHSLDSWDSLGGMDAIRRELEKSIVWPLRYRSSFDRLHLKPCSGVLLYGPPGCSKTTMARILARSSGLRFFSVGASEGEDGGLLSPYVGEGEHRLRELFRMARSLGPSLLFLDELESLFAKRELGQSQTSGVQERLLSTLLNEMDGIEAVRRGQGSGLQSNATVVVVGATNRPDKLDEALLRPGRFDRLLYVPPPDAQARKEILQIQCKKLGLELDQASMQQSVDRTRGYTGAELVSIAQEAGMLALQCLRDNGNKEDEVEDWQGVTMAQWNQALEKSRPGISPELLQVYDQFRAKRGA